MVARYMGLIQVDGSVATAEAHLMSHLSLAKIPMAAYRAACEDYWERWAIRAVGGELSEDDASWEAARDVVRRVTGEEMVEDS